MNKNKRVYNIIFLILIFFVTFQSCNKDKGPENSNSSDSSETDWLFPEHLIINGGPGKDGIASIDKPKFQTVSKANENILESDLVLIVKDLDNIKIYPHTILDWHEISNDFIGDKPITINYCPLTGTGMCWSRKLKKGQTTFGVSGLLYLTNLIPYDRESDGEWSQILAQSIHGSNRGEKAKLYPIVETEWKTAKEMYPEAQVLSTDTGRDFPYGTYPYGDYKTADTRLLFPIVPIDRRLPLKERVLGVRIGDQLKAYRFQNFQDGISVINDIFESVPIVVVGSKEHNLLVSYQRVLNDGTELDFSMNENSFPPTIIDQEGTTWDIFGKATSGPRQGQKLIYNQAIIGYWFSFGSFFPKPEIYE